MPFGMGGDLLELAGGGGAGYSGEVGVLLEGNGGVRIGAGGVVVEPVEEEVEVLFEVTFGWLDAHHIAVGSGEAGFFTEFLHEGEIDLEVEAADHYFGVV